MTKDMEICDECETVAHCAKHGCIPKQPAPVQGYVTGLDVYLDPADMKPKRYPPAQPAPVQEPIKPDTLSLEQLLRAAVYWGATYAKGDYHDALEGKIYQWISLRSGATPPAQPAPVQDAEGENKAVRCFLMIYGQAGLTVGQMKKHMAMCGFKSWPSWVDTEPDGAHLTKAGAQLWIRHLFALEATPPAAQRKLMPEWIDYDSATDVLTIHGKRYSAAMFGEDGFLSPPGTLLRVEKSQPETVTLTIAQRQWVGLDNSERLNIWEKAMIEDNGKNASLQNQPFVHFARAIESKLKEKNNG